jgi:hypothetical protein
MLARAETADRQHRDRITANEPGDHGQAVHVARRVDVQANLAGCGRDGVVRHRDVRSLRQVRRVEAEEEMVHAGVPDHRRLEDVVA